MTTLWFDVGQAETHRVAFSFDKWTGHLVITVDGVPVTQELHLFSLSLAEHWTFEVGVEERHSVVIEKRRKLLLAGVRPQAVRVWVDGALVSSDSV
ncbi:hypothetical protein [Actinomadura opuntiae]|uniref:hypothetical protein n=1 Tax=Actinomadura sp. OS1-43 TaxID=604315 RepID=UPI00255B2DC6|nr:hypothetical protein [Actinomadura sp. OS1-43]MDL4816895.1 hypothetical protein [Actinomadura sp. OS1-43]